MGGRCVVDSISWAMCYYVRNRGISCLPLNKLVGEAKGWAWMASEASVGPCFPTKLLTMKIPLGIVGNKFVGK